MTHHNDGSNSMNIIFFSVVGAIFVIAIVGLLLWMQNFSVRVTTGGGFSFNSGKRIKLTPAPLSEEAGSTGVAEGAAVASTAGPSGGAGASSGVDMDAVIAAINKGGCIACHTIPDIPGAVGQVGPNLANIGVDGATRRQGYSAEEYIRESLMEPSTFTAPECPTGPCPPGVMPQLPLDQSEIDTVISYLVTLGVE